MADRLYFIRVGGTAMGGVAGALAQAGHEVFGSEEALYEPMKSYLRDSGVTVYSDFDADRLLALGITEVVVGNAVSRGHAELEAALDARLSLTSMSQVVADKLIGKNQSLVVTGTHGKTTTTSMLAWILEVAGLKPGFLIGGVPGNWSESCRAAPALEGGLFVTEGDEYDTVYWDKRSKFMHYRPDIAIINNIEFDHADIFPDLATISNSFRLFMRLVPRRGLVIANGDDPNVLALLLQACSPVVTFGSGAACDWRFEMESDQFWLHAGGERRGPYRSAMSGEMNVRNWTAAIVAADACGVSDELIQKALATYRPPKRRQEEIGQWRGATLIDDFGHHPTAMRETLEALRTKYPDRRIVVVFEPRSNSTTRSIFTRELSEVFAGFAGVAFGALDRPERYTEEQRLDTAAIARHYESQGVPSRAISLDEGRERDWGKYLQAWLKDVVRENDLVVIFSNGDCGGLRQMLLADH